jgi:2-oxoisovalerate dehydrogenase E1 component
MGKKTATGVAPLPYTAGLTEALPYHRLFNSPISEGAIVGTAIGYAMCGGRVIPEIMYCDFLGRAGDEVFNQLPNGRL